MNILLILNFASLKNVVICTVVAMYLLESIFISFYQ